MDSLFFNCSGWWTKLMTPLDKTLTPIVWLVSLISMALRASERIGETDYMEFWNHNRKKYVSVHVYVYLCSYTNANKHKQIYLNYITCIRSSTLYSAAWTSCLCWLDHTRNPLDISQILLRWQLRVFLPSILLMD